MLHVHGSNIPKYYRVALSWNVPTAVSNILLQQNPTVLIWGRWIIQIDNIHNDDIISATTNKLQEMNKLSTCCICPPWPGI